jgi:hypothetical protein
MEHHLHCICCKERGSRTLSSRTKTVPITILLLVRLEKMSEKLHRQYAGDVHRHSTIVGNFQFLDNVQLGESGIGSQIADFEISRLFGGRSHLSNSLSTENSCLGMAFMLAEGTLALC